MDGADCGKDLIRVKGGFRTIGLVFLLFACGGDVAWDLAAENEPDHKCLRINALCAVADTRNVPAPPASIPRTCTRDDTASGAPACPSLPGGSASHGTLLFLGSLLSV